MTELQELWLNALTEPVGLLIQANKPDLLSWKLREARARMADPELRDFQVKRCEWDGGNVAIVRNAFANSPEALGL